MIWANRVLPMFIAPSGGAKAGRVAETACTVQIGDTLTIHGSRAVIGFQSTYPEINRTLLKSILRPLCLPLPPKHELIDYSHPQHP